MRLATRLAALLPILFAAPSSAASFTKIADAPSMGMGDAANAYFGNPALDEGLVAFVAYDPFPGIYMGSGGAITTIADDTTLVPGSTTQTLIAFSEPDISQGTVAFIGNDAEFLSALYTGSGGALTVVVNQTTPIPDADGPLYLSQSPAIDGENVAFTASYGTSGGGIFTSVAGVLEISANQDTEVPGSGDNDLFMNVTTLSLDGTQVVFDAYSGDAAGVYVADAGVARVVADRSTPIPGGPGNFIAFDAPSIGGGSVAFEAIGESSGGLYAEIGGVLFLINDTEVIDAISVDGDVVAYLGSAGLEIGIYVYRNGVSERLIANGDVLDGKTVSYFRFGPHGLDGDQLAFTAIFDDDTEGVFLATIPEPGTALLLVAGLAMLCARRRV